MPEMTPVTSSLIAAVGYDPETEELSVEFQKGDTYVYRDVPQAVFDALVGSLSVGQFFLRNVKNQYVCTKESSGPPLVLVPGLPPGIDLRGRAK